MARHSMLEPRLEEYEKSINNTKFKIKQMKNKLALETNNTMKKDERNPVLQLNLEYEKLSQLRVEQCSSLLDQWSTYQTEERQTRKSDIDKRQAEFDKELDLQHNKPVMQQQDKKSETYKKLIHLLKKVIEEGDQERIHILGSHQDTKDNDTSVITISTDILELFWSIDVSVPVTLSETLLAIAQLENLK